MMGENKMKTRPVAATTVETIARMTLVEIKEFADLFAKSWPNLAVYVGREIDLALREVDEHEGRAVDQYWSTTIYKYKSQAKALTKTAK
jgi:hypothetical protein